MSEIIGKKWSDEVDKRINKNQYNPDYYIHPGDHILEHLRSMNDNLVWRKFTGEDKSFLFYLIVGTASIDSMSAIKLAEWFGGTQELWLNLQKQYDERVEKHG